MAGQTIPSVFQQYLPVATETMRIQVLSPSAVMFQTIDDPNTEDDFAVRLFLHEPNVESDVPERLVEAITDSLDAYMMESEIRLYQLSDFIPVRGDVAVLSTTIRLAPWDEEVFAETSEELWKLLVGRVQSCL